MDKHEVLVGFSKELNILNIGISDEKASEFTERAVKLFNERIALSMHKHDLVDGTEVRKMYNPEIDNLLTISMKQPASLSEPLTDHQIADMFAVSYYLGKYIRPEHITHRAMSIVHPHIHMWILLNEDTTKKRFCNILSHYNNNGESYHSLIEFIKLASKHPGFYNTMANFRDYYSEFPYSIVRNLFSHRILNSAIHSVVSEMDRLQLEEALDSVHYLLNEEFFIKQCNRVGIHEDIINDKVEKIRKKFNKEVLEIITDSRWEDVITKRVDSSGYMLDKRYIL